MSTNPRRIFLKSAAFGAGYAILGITRGLAMRPDQKEKPPPIAGEIVKEFVGAGHGKFDRVQQMLAETPNLLNASWDWGGGDYESAIEGAGHMGNREIAEYLLSRGARLNIFAAAMLGKIDIVKSTLTAFPELKTSKGPHGIMLLQHATKGGDQAKEVLEYLKEIGAT
ncbi:MAG TPA: hypothetical protein VK508_00140 [Cyclobacteriaceae bacterium]|nr:hypothetical protein [Cyclobacteriaceae bacterium]